MPLLVTEFLPTGKTWAILEQKDGSDLSSDVSVSTNEEEAEDDIDRLIREKSNKRNISEVDGTDLFVKPQLMEIFKQYEKEPRLKKEENVLNYWNGLKFTRPELFRLSQIALAVPTTQVSIEGSFSGLKFILSDQRGSLNSAILEDICLIRSNAIFLAKD